MDVNAHATIAAIFRIARLLALDPKCRCAEAATGESPASASCIRIAIKDLDG
jgi:hypothetical protein